jgi:hypothetical protein
VAPPEGASGKEGGMRLQTSLAAVIAIAVTVPALSFQPPNASAAGDTAALEVGDLPLMVLPLAQLGDEFADFELDPENGFAREDEREPGEINSYGLMYSSEDAFAEGAFLVGTAVALMEDAGAAEALVGSSIEEVRSDVGDGGTVEEFPVVNLADQAVGMTLEVGVDGFALEGTFVLFRSDQLLGGTLIFGNDLGDVRAQAETMARALLGRIKGVLSGEITELPAALPPDPNCDGEIDAIDAALILQLTAALLGEADCDLLTEANYDGRTDAVDAQLILQFTAGLIEELPV